jgi:hypothetical protein
MEFIYLLLIMAIVASVVWNFQRRYCRICPHCGESIPKIAKVCKSCTRDVPPLSLEDDGGWPK